MNTLLAVAAISALPFYSQSGYCKSHVLRDQASKDQTFPAFRQRLTKAVRSRDRQFLQSVVAPQILTAIGGTGDSASFYQQWHDLAPESAFWERMERILSHGARLVYITGEIHIPAIDFDDTDSDAIQGVVWAKKAPLFSKPDESSTLLQQLGNEQLTILEPSEPSPINAKWVKVLTRKKIVGYMKSDDLYSEYDEFAQFREIDGHWSLTWFGFAGK